MVERAESGASDGVTVVIATKDRRALLRTTLATVLVQRGPELEVVVVDDGSTDGTASDLQLLADPRIRVVRHERSLGVARARNAGLAQASKPWVAFVDDDDLWAPDKLASQLAVLQKGPPSDQRWATGGAVIVDDQLRVVRHQPAQVAGDVAARCLRSNVVPGGASGVVAPTRLVRSVGGFDPALSLLADWDLWIRLALERELLVVPRPLHAYRAHAASMSSRVVGGAVETELGVIEHRYASERRRHGVVLDVAGIEHWLGDREQRAGRRMAAGRAYLRASPSLGRARAAMRAAEALAWPGAYRIRDRRASGHAAASWRAEVEAWLDPLRSGSNAREVGSVLARQRRGRSARAWRSRRA